MKKDKGYGLLWMLAAEVVLLIFFLAIAPRLNAEGLLYRSAVPVTPEEVLSKDDNGSFELKYGAGYPCTCLLYTAYEVNDIVHLMREQDPHVIVNMIKTENFYGGFYQAPIE